MPRLRMAALLGADRRAMSIVLAALALARWACCSCSGDVPTSGRNCAIWSRRWRSCWPSAAALGVVGDPAPNWPYLLALTAGVVVTAGLAIFESAPLWLLPAGVFLSLDYHALLDAFFHPDHGAFASPERRG